MKLPSDIRGVAWIEDDPMSIDTWVKLLEPLGWKIRTAESLSDAFELLETEADTIDLIILDVMLKLTKADRKRLSKEDLGTARSGYEAGMVLARRVLRDYPEIPIVVLSGQFNPLVEEWFRQSGIPYLSKSAGFQSAAELKATIEAAVSGKPRLPKSFIVHGHDHATLLELKNYLQNTLRLPEPIILHEQPSKGRTIIEKFEEEASDVDLAFVLLTPDDLGGPQGTPPEKMGLRARQNVILELGYFLSSLRRRSGRVFVLHKGDIELPSDIAGVIYVDVSGGILPVGEILRRELAEIDFS